MGNSQSQDQDVLMQSLANKRELDISKKLTHTQYVKHTRGEDIEGCLTDLPWDLIDEVSLYERVNASFNLVSTLPVELPLRLPHLQHLNLSHNRIKELPESIALYFHLEELNVSYNLLESLPRNITNMRRLAVLDVSHNRFRQLPDDVGLIPGLRKLNASYNQLSLLPTSLGSSDSVRVLLVDGNKFLSTIYEAGSDNVLAQLLLFGAALGDALGLATEGLSRDQCRFHYEPDYTLADTVRDELRVRYRDGDWTANTDLTLVALDSLLHWGGVLDELDLAQRLHGWRHRGLPELADARRPAADLLAVRTIDTAGFTEAPHAAARRASGSANNNLSPARIPRFHDLSEVAGNAQRVCLTTHAQPLCVAASVTLAALVAQLLQGRGQTAADMEHLLSAAGALGEKFTTDEHERDALNSCFRETGEDSTEPVVDGEGGLLSALAAAVDVLRRSSRTLLSMMGLWRYPNGPNRTPQAP
ncbi:uncharacterized protein LOC119111616 [Pollicipes pollicipes]|uniref:uncharacterized protein LOC119111616 n=1 Tax=Pollicipes pollicipes TaxID=41117 RepID=UPI001884CB42|nr:uncharacterized protein LOC119111616 [Pollicipes pollicipes]